MEILEAPQKSKTKSNGKQPERPEPFYIDQAKLDAELRNQERITRKIVAARNTYESVTADNITTIEQLQVMISDPTAYFVRLKEQQAQKQKAKITEVFGDGLDLKSFIKNSLPERFNEVVNACRLCENVRWKFYRIADDGKLELTQEFHDKLNNTCYFYATTPNQVKRLDFARRMVKMLSFEMRELLIDQAKENGQEHAIQNDLRMTSFIAGLPCCVRMVRSYDGKYTFGKLLINEQWVVHGFNKWVPNVIKPVKRPEYTRRVRLCVYPGGSLAHKYTIFEHPAWPVDPTRTQKTIILPNWYLIRGGRLYDTGEKAPRLPDAPLLTQLSETPQDIKSKPYMNVV